MLCSGAGTDIRGGTVNEPDTYAAELSYLDQLENGEPPGDRATAQESAPSSGELAARAGQECLGRMTVEGEPKVVLIT